MHSRCAYVRHSLYSYSSHWFFGFHLRFAHAQTVTRSLRRHDRWARQRYGRALRTLAFPYRRRSAMGRPRHQRHSGRKRLGNHPCRSSVGRADTLRLYRLCLVPAGPSHHPRTRCQNQLSIAAAQPGRRVRGLLERQVGGPIWKATSAPILAGLECARSLHLA